MSRINPDNFPKPGPCWLSAPAESSPAFLPVFGAISIAVQTALRERLAQAYFDGTTSFMDRNKAYPMLIYQASRPFHPKTKTDLTYDILNPKMVQRLFHSVRARLLELLREAEERLRAEGELELAGLYAPKRAAEIVKWVKRLAPGRRRLYGLVHNESMLVEALVQLGGLGNAPPKEQSVRMASFAKRWDFQMRRLYRPRDFSWLGPALFDEATRALCSCQESLRDESQPSASEIICKCE